MSIIQKNKKQKVLDSCNNQKNRSDIGLYGKNINIKKNEKTKEKISYELSIIKQHPEHIELVQNLNGEQSKMKRLNRCEIVNKCNKKRKKKNKKTKKQGIQLIKKGGEMIWMNGELGNKGVCELIKRQKSGQRNNRKMSNSLNEQWLVGVNNRLKNNSKLYQRLINDKNVIKKIEVQKELQQNNIIKVSIQNVQQHKIQQKQQNNQEINALNKQFNQSLSIQYKSNQIQNQKSTQIKTPNKSQNLQHLKPFKSFSFTFNQSQYINNNQSQIKSTKQDYKKQVIQIRKNQIQKWDEMINIVSIKPQQQGNYKNIINNILQKSVNNKISLYKGRQYGKTFESTQQNKHSEYISKQMSEQNLSSIQIESDCNLHIQNNGKNRKLKCIEMRMMNKINRQSQRRLNKLLNLQKEILMDKYMVQLQKVNNDQSQTSRIFKQMDNTNAYLQNNSLLIKKALNIANSYYIQYQIHQLYNTKPQTQYTNSFTSSISLTSQQFLKFKQNTHKSHIIQYSTPQPQKITLSVIQQTYQTNSPKNTWQKHLTNLLNLLINTQIIAFIAQIAHTNIFHSFLKTLHHKTSSIIQNNQIFQFIKLVQYHLPSSQILIKRFNNIKIINTPLQMLRLIRQDYNNYNQLIYESIIPQSICRLAIKKTQLKLCINQDKKQQVYNKVLDVNVCLSKQQQQVIKNSFEEIRKEQRMRAEQKKMSKQSIYNEVMHCVFDAWNENILQLKMKGEEKKSFNSLNLLSICRGKELKIKEIGEYMNKSKKQIIKIIEKQDKSLFENIDQIQNEMWINHRQELLIYGLEVSQSITQLLFEQIQSEIMILFF